MLEEERKKAVLGLALLVLALTGHLLVQLGQEGAYRAASSDIGVGLIALGQRWSNLAVPAVFGTLCFSSGGSDVLAIAADLAYSRNLPLASRRPNLARTGWAGSSLYLVVTQWDDDAFRRVLRLSRAAFDMTWRKLRDSGQVRDNMCNAAKYKIPAWFKVAVCLHHLAHGGTWYQTAAAVGLADSTCRAYTYSVCRAIFFVLRPIFMHPPTQAECLKSQERFADRKGILNVGLAVDGTHVPYRPDNKFWKNEFRNYKGWHSVLCVMVVNSFYMFVDAEVGHPGRCSDATVTEESAFWEDIKADFEAWLGPMGMLISDGAIGLSDIVLTPYPRSAGMTEKRRWFNFCHSSTRIYVEQIFGMWKNRWRINMFESKVHRSFLSLMIYATLILHNICCIYNLGSYKGGPDEIDASMVQKYMEAYPHDRCSQCRKNASLHCSHRNRSAANSWAEVSSEAASMRQRRDEIADKLWDAYFATHGKYPVAPRHD
eukprot:scaffold395992_cov48-Prasinocladus_malaysianus.AAC.2